MEKSSGALLVGITALIGAVVGSVTTEAQPPTKMARVGVFVPGSRSGDQFQLLVKAFHHGLRELGWIEGQTVVIETRWGEGRLDEFPSMRLRCRASRRGREGIMSNHSSSPEGRRICD